MSQPSDRCVRNSVEIELRDVSPRSRNDALLNQTMSDHFAAPFDSPEPECQPDVVLGDDGEVVEDRYAGIVRHRDIVLKREIKEETRE